MPASKVLLNIIADTKQEEEQIINQFLLRLGYPVPQLISRESPDFAFQVKDWKIGVEVTKYYADLTSRGSVSQKKIGEWVKLSKEIKERIKSKSPDHVCLYGAIHFIPGSSSYGKFRKSLAQAELMTLIDKNRLPRGGETTVTVSPIDYPELGKYVRSVFLWDKYPEQEYLWWDASLQSGAVAEDNGALEHIIRKKEISSTGYEKDYHQRWLIIYAAGIGLSDIYLDSPESTIRQGRRMVKREDDAPGSIQKEYKADYFTHIFIWDKFSERIFLLVPYYKKIFDGGERTIHVNHLPLNKLI